MGVYAARSYLDRHPFRADAKKLSGHRVIRTSGSLGDIPACQWFAGLGGTVALLSSSPIAQLGACARGQGVALLPTALADDGRFVRLDLPTCTAGHVWLVAVATEATHPRLATFLRRARRFGVEREVVLPESA